MSTNAGASTGSRRRETQIVGGFFGWLKRLRWRREARKLAESDIEELRKRLVIVERQLEEMPISRRIHRRRMELLIDRERCRTIISTWETARKR